MTRQVVAFGPVVIDGKAHPGTTFSWDGSRWTVLSTHGEIPGFTHAGLANDPESRRTILFGGFYPFNNSDQTWALEAGAWTQLKPKTHPTAQTSPAMAVDSVRGQLLLFGGCCGPGSVPNGGSIPLAETWA